MHQAIRMTCSIIVTAGLGSAGLDIMATEPMAGVLLLIAAFFAVSYFVEELVRLYKEITNG